MTNTPTKRGHALETAEKIKTSVQITSLCKRGHLKTEATTFERVVTVKGRKYRVRECRLCHAQRNHRIGSGKTGRVNKNRWQASA